MPKIGQNCMKKWPFFAIFLPWMASYGPKRSFLLIFSARDDLVKVSWKSDAGKCPNQVTPPYFDQLSERHQLLCDWQIFRAVHERMRADDEEVFRQNMFKVKLHDGDHIIIFAFCFLKGYRVMYKIPQIFWIATLKLKGFFCHGMFTVYLNQRWTYSTTWIINEIEKFWSGFS